VAGSDDAWDALADRVLDVLTTDYRPWQSHTHPCDVNVDGKIEPLDVAVIVNELNAGGARSLPVPYDPGGIPPAYWDVSGDGILAPSDALLVVNYVNMFGARWVGSSQSVEASDSLPGRQALRQAKGEPVDGQSAVGLASGSAARGGATSVKGTERESSVRTEQPSCQPAPATDARVVLVPGVEQQLGLRAFEADAFYEHLGRDDASPCVTHDHALDELVSQLAGWQARFGLLG
jgi:hypothetical protein